MNKKISEEKLYRTVGQEVHPGISRTLVELGMVKNVTLENDKAIINLTLPILSVPAFIKGQLVNSLTKVAGGLGAEVEVRITEMKQEERQAFLAMEKESWKGLK